MLLYVCPKCGRWQDVSISQVVQKALEPLARWSAKMQEIEYTEPEQDIYACPGACGLMVQVSPADRLFVRPSVVEATSERMMVEYQGDLKYLEKEQ